MIILFGLTCDHMGQKFKRPFRVKVHNRFTVKKLCRTFKVKTMVTFQILEFALFCFL